MTDAIEGSGCVAKPPLVVADPPREIGKGRDHRDGEHHRAYPRPHPALNGQHRAGTQRKGARRNVGGDPLPEPEGARARNGQRGRGAVAAEGAGVAEFQGAGGERGGGSPTRSETDSKLAAFDDDEPKPAKKSGGGPKAAARDLDDAFADLEDSGF